MAYTTEEIIRAESPFKSVVNIDSDYFDRVIADVDSTIDSKVGIRYQLPLDETPNMIRDIATSLAIAFIGNDQSKNVEIVNGVNMLDELTRLMGVLDMISKGEEKLFDSTGVELTLQSHLLVSSYPTQATTDSEDTKRKFTINQKF